MARVRRNTDKKESLEALLSQSLQDQILSSVDDGISVQDLDLRIVFANDKHRQMFGDEVIGKYCFEAYERNNEPCEGCPVLKSFETGEAIRDVRTAVDREGNTRRAEISASPIRGADGNIIGGVEVIRDLGKQYELQQALAEKSSRLERLAEVAREISSGHDLKTILESVVMNAVEMTECDAGVFAILDSRRSVITYPYSYNMPGEINQIEIPEGKGVAGRVIKSAESVMVDEYAEDADHLSQFADLGVRAILGVPVIVGDRPLGALGLCSKKEGRRFSETDLEIAFVIADQASVAIENAEFLNQARDGLRVQKELNRVAASISSGLDLNRVLHQVARLATETISADAAMLALLDEQTGEVTFPIAFNLPDHLRQVSSKVGESISGSVIATGEARIDNDYQESEERNEAFAAAGVRAVATMPLKTSGRSVGAIGIMDLSGEREFNEHDIELLSTISQQAAVAIENAQLYEELSRSTQELEKRVQERTEELSRLYDESERKSKQLEEANIRLKEVDRLKSEFLANMSHELRTPLNSIIGFSKLILDGLDGALSSEQRRDLEIVHSSGHVLTRLIDDVLNLARIEAGRITLDIREEDPVKIVREAINACDKIVAAKGLTLEYDLPEEAQPVRVDAGRIRQVVRYLIENAVKFTEEGTIRVHIEQSSGKTDFVVADTGIGMEADQIDAVFERFHQVSPGLAEKGGMGLGLAISKRLVEMHGGTIGVASRIGKGSTFTVSIPHG